MSSNYRIRRDGHFNNLKSFTSNRIPLANTIDTISLNTEYPPGGYEEGSMIYNQGNDSVYVRTNLGPGPIWSQLVTSGGGAAGNLQNAYDLSGPVDPQILTTATNGPVKIRATATTSALQLQDSGGNPSFEVETNGTSDNILIGNGAINTGISGIAVGKDAEVSNNAENAIAIGSSDATRMGARCTNSNALAICTGSVANGVASIAIGLESNTSTNSQRSIAIGNNASIQNSTIDSIALGSDAIVDGVRDAIAIGRGATVTSDEGIAIGTNVSAPTPGFWTILRGTSPGINVSFTAPGGSPGEIIVDTSSIRYKENIRDLEAPGSKFDKIRSVRYRPINKKDVECIGFIAEEMNEVYPEIVPKDQEGLPISVRYDLLVPVLVKEIQELKKTVSDLQKKM